MGLFRRRVIVSVLFMYTVFLIITGAEAFNCSSSSGFPTCNSLIDYLPPNSTSLSNIKTLFGVKKFQSLLGANNLPLSTSPHQTVEAQQRIKIPFPCICSNGTGMSNRRPLYKVVPDDGLDHIARVVFSGLVTYQQIQAANNIPNPDLISVGQELWIPLPCSCDQVEGLSVVHYGHVVAPGSTVDGIARQYNTSSATLLNLNGLPTPNDLMAGAVLDVPLLACRSMVANNSLDYPLLVSNDSYVFTASGCVMCKCDAAANNRTLQCEPSSIAKSPASSCPAMQCQGGGADQSLYIGNTTTSTASACNRTTCAYAGYTNQTTMTILTTLDIQSTCPVGNQDSSGQRFSMGGWSWNMILIPIHLVLLASLHLHQ